MLVKPSPGPRRSCDGANIEITREIGEQNIFLFGNLAEDVEDLRHAHNYGTFELDASLKAVFEAIKGGMFGDAGAFGALVSGISGSFYALDLGLARDIVVDRRAAEVGHVVPTRGKGVGLQALTWREWQRLRRFPQPLFVLAATVVIPYACDALGMSAITPIFAAQKTPVMEGLTVGDLVTSEFIDPSIGVK